MSEADREAGRLWLRRAQETLAEADTLATAEQWRGCLNRLYYACFYAVRALLVSEGIQAKTHAGVRSQFSNRFIRTGRLSPDLATFYSDLFEERMESDYVYAWSFDEAAVPDWLRQAHTFVEAAADLLKG